MLPRGRAAIRVAARDLTKIRAPEAHLQVSKPCNAPTRDAAVVISATF
jgi:hypothetical protein